MNDSNCPCNPIFQEDLNNLEVKASSEDVFGVKHLTSTLIFAPTLVGTKTRKTFKIHNDTMDKLTYIIQTDPNKNSIYRVFDFEISNYAIPTGGYLACTVVYSPTIANERNVDYLQIIDKNLKIYTICIQGPSVQISTKVLHFYIWKHKQHLTNAFEIRNTSNILVMYEFDKNYEEEPDIFKLDRVCGTIAPFRHVYVTVKFTAEKTGMYIEPLVCKILHHEPIVVELIGVHANHLTLEFSNVLFKHYPKENLNPFNCYMQDSVKTTTQKPLFSLTVNYLDFGRMEYSKTAQNSHTLVTSLTNHIQEEIEVVWDKTVGVFSISPSNITVPSAESILFEVKFKPDNADRLYSHIFTGWVYWGNIRSSLKCVVTEIAVPLSLTLTVVGHSFPGNKHWLPRVQLIPDIIIVPPSMPMSSTYTTCMLRCSGHLPSLFKFIPPKKSNFIIKPMVGIVHDFHIIVVLLQSDPIDKKAYIERWGLELNGQCGDCITFYAKGYSEYPSITVGVNNIVTFNMVHPGCQDISSVAIKNNSIHFLEYNFVLKKKKPFIIDHPKGRLASNENLTLQWYFNGDLRFPEESTIKCEVHTVQKVKLLTGIPLDSNITVYTKCAYSQLCAMPNSHDFGEVTWGSMNTTSFYLFNFGESPIHFKLLPKNHLDVNNHMNIIPSQGTVSFKEKLKIYVHVKSKINGLQEIQLMYQIRLNVFSDIIIDDGKGYDIFSIQLFGFYPTVQIEDIPRNNFGFLFSKVFLWEMFKIDEINFLLRSLEHDETKEIKIVVPDYEISYEHYFANFLLRNVTKSSLSIKLSRHKLCSCNSLQETMLDCAHKDMVCLILTTSMIEPNQLEILKMIIQYLEEGTTQILYTFEMSNNRKINLYIDVNVMPKIATVASKYAPTYEFKLTNTFIGEQNPPAQAFDLYNNSQSEINYEVDLTPLYCLNYSYDFTILKCINPTGIIKPFSTKQLLFKFMPIEICTHKVMVPLKMGETLISLHIYGDGILNHNSHISKMATTMPSFCKYTCKEDLIDLSTDYLIIEPFPTWSTVEKLIFIRNQTPDRVIGYSWQPCAVEAIVKAEAFYHKGVLQPKESHAIIIQISSFDEPCSMRLQMTCKILDHTQHLLHQKSVIAYNCNQERLAGQFTITENETTFPENEAIIIPDTNTTYVTLAIGLCVTSIDDRDICTNVEKQMKQSPKYGLLSNVDCMFKDYYNRSEESKLQAVAECSKIGFKNQDFGMFRLTIEQLIGDVLFSDFFCKVMEENDNSAQPYYIQFKKDHLMNEDTHNCQKLLHKETEIAGDFLNIPKAPFVENILKDLIFETIHEIFQLGPPVKKRPDKKITSTPEKYKCPICKCEL